MVLKSGISKAKVFEYQKVVDSVFLKESPMVLRSESSEAMLLVWWGTLTVLNWDRLKDGATID